MMNKWIKQTNNYLRTLIFTIIKVMQEESTFLHLFLFFVCASGAYSHSLRKACVREREREREGVCVYVYLGINKLVSKIV